MRDLARICLSSAILSATAFATPPRPESSDVLDWVEKAGFPDLKKCPFVRVRTGVEAPDAEVGKEPEIAVLDGFLLKDDGKTFSVFVVTLKTNLHQIFVMSDPPWWPLTTATFTRSVATVPARERVEYEILDLKREATALSRKLQTPLTDKEDTAEWEADFGRHLDRNAATVIFASGCRQNGLTNLANDLVKPLPGRVERRRSEQHRKRKTFLQFTKDELCETLLWRATLDFDDLEISRMRLLARFGGLARYFPGTEYQAQIQETTALLGQMVAEDLTHQNRPIDHLDTEEKVKELIFQLRDQNGAQVMQPGSCDIFARDDPKSPTSPAAQLVKLKYAAVPQLIAALGDQRLTRSIGFHRGFYFSHYVLRVGDCAETILERIANRSFYQPASTSSTMGRDNKTADTKRAIEEWWSEFQKKGERQYLVDAVTRGDQNSLGQADLLLEKYPGDATATLIAGARTASDDNVRAELVKRIAMIRTNEVAEFLHQELVEAPGTKARLQAANALQERGDNAGVQPMIAEWAKWVAESKQNADKGTALIQFLANCGKIEAINALRDSIPDLRMPMRFSMVSGYAPNKYKLASGPWMSELWTDDATTVPAIADGPEVTDAIEAQLISFLTDRRLLGISGGFGEAGVDYGAGRLCDYTAFILTKRWPKRYSFHWSLYWLENDRQLRAIEDSWRKRKGIATQETPEPSKAKSLVHNSPTRIDNVRYDSETDRATAAHLEKLRGGFLTPDKLRDEIDFLGRNLPTGSQGFYFVAERMNSSVGFVVDFHWIGEHFADWPNTQEEVIKAGRVVQIEPDLGITKPSVSVSKELQKALADGSDQPIAVHYVTTLIE